MWEAQFVRIYVEGLVWDRASQSRGYGEQSRSGNSLAQETGVPGLMLSGRVEPSEVLLEANRAVKVHTATH